MAKQINTLRIDPTRLTMARRRFATKLRTKFDSLKREINTLIVTEDVFGLNSPNPGNPITGNTVVVNARWSALSSQEKLKAFKEWLRVRVDDKLLSLSDEELWRKYTEEGYRKGVMRAYDDTKRAVRFKPGEGEFYQGSRQQFLRDSFFRPVSVEKVKLLASRSFEDLKGVTSEMATRMGRILTDGLVQGLGPREIARLLNNQVDGIGKSRALMIARTELTRAHSEGQLDSFESLGVEEVGVMVEWSAVSADACPLCIPLDGIVLKLSEARGMIPRHPNCRCAWIAANVGEKDKKQKRAKRQIDRAITKSVKEETGERTNKEAFDKSIWQGADADIDKKRPVRNESPEIPYSWGLLASIINHIRSQLGR